MMGNLARYFSRCVTGSVRETRTFVEAQDGAAAVEFALVGPILVIAALSMVDIGLAISEQMAIEQVLRSAAATAMSGAELSEIQSTLEGLSVGEDFVPEVVPACSPPCSGTESSNGFLLSAGKHYDGLIIDIPELKSSLLVQVQ